MNEFANCLRRSSDKEVILKEKRLDAVFIGLEAFTTVQKIMFFLLLPQTLKGKKRNVHRHTQHNIRF